jgi:hypothetical protein
MFAHYYVFNLLYDASCVATLEFIQRSVNQVFIRFKRLAEIAALLCVCVGACMQAHVCDATTMYRDYIISDIIEIFGTALG